jgi:hydrogenase maturation protease
LAEFEILIYGYGNPGRQDDGLGNAFVDDFSQWIKMQGKTGFEFDSNYQLNIEDSTAISDKDLVIFIDASTEDIKDFILTPVNSETQVTFTTHAASPGYIVQLCHELYGREPAVFLLHIRGYEWDFKEGLTQQAQMNLANALEFMKVKLLNPKNLIESYKKINH